MTFNTCLDCSQSIGAKFRYCVEHTELSFKGEEKYIKSHRISLCVIYNAHVLKYLRE